MQDLYRFFRIVFIEFVGADEGSQSKLLIELNINQGVRLEVLKNLFRISRGAIDMQKARIMDKLRECFKRKKFKLDF